MSSIYDYSVTNRKNEQISLSNYKGKIIIIVNTATGCGFTPHYKNLENMYEQYHSSGLEIIDIPCNQFKNQAPGTDDEIHEFCTLKYKTQFEQMKKSNVNGKDELPLYTYLKSQKNFEGFGCGVKSCCMWIATKCFGSDEENNDIKWNFTKFIVDRNGNVVKRFEPTTDMEEVEEYVKNLL